MKKKEWTPRCVCSFFNKKNPNILSWPCDVKYYIIGSDSMIFFISTDVTFMLYTVVSYTKGLITIVNDFYANINVITKNYFNKNKTVYSLSEKVMSCSIFGANFQILANQKAFVCA